MIYLGNKKIGKVYLGDKKLSRIYLGDKLIWDGYPEGHIIGTTDFINDTAIHLADTTGDYTIKKLDGTTYDLTTVTSEKRPFDFDLSKGVAGDSNFFYDRSNITSVKSFKITIHSDNSSTTSNTIASLFIYCPDITYVNINGIKISGANMDAYNICTSCSSLETVEAGRFPWNQINSLYSGFYGLPKLKVLNLSGANFDSVDINIWDYNFTNLGSIGTIVKVVGCSETTQNKILTKLNSTNNQTWELKDGIITRTK